jgi:hypothetical protein
MASPPPTLKPPADKAAPRTRRAFQLRLTAKPGADPIRALRALLKIALRRFGLRCLGIKEEVPRA